MKKLFAFLASALILCSCGPKSQNAGAENPAEVVINDPYSGMSGALGSIIRFDRFSEYSDIPVSVVCCDYSETVLKILAEDSDIDIYFLNPSDARKLIESGIYEPIVSETIERHNESCFDYLKDFCEVDGKTVLTPIMSSVTAILVPNEAADDMPDISCIDGYLNWVRSCSGERKAYTRGDDLYTFLNYQYEKYYCAFKNRTFDYDTEIYRHIYSELLSGFERYSNPPETVVGFESAGAKNLAEQKDLLAAEGGFWEFADCAEDFRAFPIPKISEKVGGNFVNAIFAYINPYGKNKEAAVKVLETIAENYSDLTDGGIYEIFNYPFIKKDREDYGEKYSPESRLFGDFYAIAKNGFVHDYQLLSARNDIDLYQSGKISLDEAIEMYAREVGAWLNE